jgi:CheY-like chemotaxis protein
MDMHMPKMDGLEAIRRIRGSEGRGRVPIIALTANAMALEREACFEAGMDDFIAKPLDLHLFLLVVDRWLNPPPAAPDEAGLQATG